MVVFSADAGVVRLWYGTVVVRRCRGVHCRLAVELRMKYSTVAWRRSSPSYALRQGLASSSLILDGLDQSSRGQSQPFILVIT